ncbi:MAG: glycosyl hydrolase, partial [Firmicutes bacterium HGW-Firmicutes-20]
MNEDKINDMDIVNQMTNQEKAQLGSGADFWHTQPIARLGIPSIMMTDGPHGLRKQKEQGDHIGANQSYPATCFPTAATIANSWDKELLGLMGEALARECHSQHVSVLLGPGINIKRSPLCGRNFEYFSEDPFLTGE